MELNTDILNILKEHESLKEQAMQGIHALCNSHHGMVCIKSDDCIDLYSGNLLGMQPVLVLAVKQKKEQIFLEVEYDNIPGQDEMLLYPDEAIDVLKLLRDASIDMERQFMHEKRFLNHEERDRQIEGLWLLLSDKTINEDDEMDEPFLYWDEGTPRFEIWQWFDSNHSKGVGWLNDHIA